MSQAKVINPNTCFAMILGIFVDTMRYICDEVYLQIRSVHVLCVPGYKLFQEKGSNQQALGNFSGQIQVSYCRHFLMSEGSLNVLQIPHVTTCWQTFLGLSDGEFLARVPGMFHCLIPGACEEDEAVWLPAFSFCFLLQSDCLSLIQLYVYPMRTLTTPFNNVHYELCICFSQHMA